MLERRHRRIYKDDATRAMPAGVVTTLKSQQDALERFRYASVYFYKLRLVKATDNQIVVTYEREAR